MTTNSLDAVRKDKFDKLETNPFHNNHFDYNTDSNQLRVKFGTTDSLQLAAIDENFSLAGRITRIRNFGNLIFADLKDEVGNIQLMLKKDEKFKNLVDLGDIIGVTGQICKTQKGELSIRVKQWQLLSKCFHSLPDTHYGLNDTEERFRKRYLDFIVNPGKKEIIFLRHQVIKTIRRFFDDQGFIEVETPILVAAASGAQAKPFVTHHNKLNRDFFLRIATEIPLKKMLIGGFEKVYEIGRIFRNEGIDARHNPEFTTIEVYRSYQNANYMRVKTEQLFHTLAQKLAITNLTFNQQVINITKPFAQLTMLEAIKHYAGVDLNNISVSQAQRLAQQHQLDLAEFQHDLDNITLAFFDKYVEKKLIQPTFITDYPLATSPLAKSKFGDPTLADRFELFIGGIEFANGYSELNDPQEQQIRFQQQAQQQQLGNEEIAAFDKEFIEALEYGMPPAAGLGIGIDRLVMLFSQQNSIKEVIAFPQLKEKS